MTEQTTESPTIPTIQELERKKNVENLLGAKLIKTKILFGKEFYFYEDGSVLVIDPSSHEYHFITKEGKKRRKLREDAKRIIENYQKLLPSLQLLGKGRFSTVYELETPIGPIAVKITTDEGLFLKEFAEEISKQAASPINGLVKRDSGKLTVQKMSLADVIRLFKKLDEAGIRRPEFYGFSIKRNPNGQIEEFQFMERINRPTIQEIINAMREGKEAGTNIPQTFPYTSFLNELCNKYFEGNFENFTHALIESFLIFIQEVKAAIPEIGDLEADNIFLVGYDENTGSLEFMVIDPIYEEIIIRNNPKPPTGKLLYNKTNKTKLIYDNKEFNNTGFKNYKNF